MKIPKNPIVYVTKDRERADGMAENENYSIVAGNGEMDSLELLSQPETAVAIDTKKAAVLVFKNTKQIENITKAKNWKLLNPPAELAETIENKVTQATWLAELAELLPPHNITLVKNIAYTPNENTSSIIIQWAHSHTGQGTLHIQKESELQALKEKFPEREARVTTFIKGPMFTANIVVAHNTILVGNISYQITGLTPFTDHLFSTIGNDWSIPFSILTEKHLSEFDSLAQRIATKLQGDGWRGLFGIDVIYDEERDKLFLIEINARQPASTTYESQLQERVRSQGVVGLTTFEAHILAVTDEKITEPLVPINDGAQIIQRVTSTVTNANPSPLRDAGYNVIEYKNSKLNSDLLRIQSTRGIMEAHNSLNKRGQEINTLLAQHIAVS